MGNVQFGGPLGEILDLQSQLRVSPRCSGSATVAFEPADDFRNAARQSLIKHTKEQIDVALRSGKSILSVAGAPTFASAIAAAVSNELGVPLQVTQVQLGLSEQDADALTKFAIAAAQKNRAAAAAAAVAPKPANANVCSRCGKGGGGKFCASCGGPMIAGAAPTAASAVAPPQNVSPTNETIPPGNWLFCGEHRVLAAGSRVRVPAGFVFIGFVDWAISMNLPPGDHVLAQGVQKFAFMSTTGLPFVITTYRNHVKLEIRGTWYIQDPLAVFKETSKQNDDFGLFEIVVGRASDTVKTDNERDLCVGTAAAYLKDGNNLKGTVVVIDSMRPIG